MKSRRYKDVKLRKRNMNSPFHAALVKLEGGDSPDDRSPHKAVYHNLSLSLKGSVDAIRMYWTHDKFFNFIPDF